MDKSRVIYDPSNIEFSAGRKDLKDVYESLEIDVRPAKPQQKGQLRKPLSGPSVKPESQDAYRRSCQDGAVLLAFAADREPGGANAELKALKDLDSYAKNIKKASDNEDKNEKQILFDAGLSTSKPTTTGLYARKLIDSKVTEMTGVEPEIVTNAIVDYVKESDLGARGGFFDTPESLESLARKTVDGAYEKKAEAKEAAEKKAAEAQAKKLAKQKAKAEKAKKEIDSLENDTVIDPNLPIKMTSDVKKAEAVENTATVEKDASGKKGSQDQGREPLKWQDRQGIKKDRPSIDPESIAESRASSRQVK